MFIRFKNGRPYAYRTARIDGKVVQFYLGPAGPEQVQFLRGLRSELARIAAARRERRRETHEREERRSEQWRIVEDKVRTAMVAAGYHNPKGRGWRRKRGHISGVKP